MLWITRRHASQDEQTTFTGWYRQRGVWLMLLASVPCFIATFLAGVASKPS